MKESYYSILGMRSLEPEDLILDFKNDMRISTTFMKKYERDLKKAELEGKSKEEIKQIEMKIIRQQKKMEAMQECVANYKGDTGDCSRENLIKIAILVSYMKAEDIYNERKSKIEEDYKINSDSPYIKILAELEDEKNEKLEDIKSKFDKEKEAYNKLKGDYFRKQYDIELKELKYKEGLEHSKKIRMQNSKELVKRILGDNFTHNMSHLRIKDRIFEEDKKSENPMFKWKVNLYSKEREVLSGVTNDRKYPEMNQDIKAYSYGTFEYETFFEKSGRPTFSNQTCEIIGVTKRNIDGTNQTNFLIAPLRKLAEIIKTDSTGINELEHGDRKFVILSTPEQIRRENKRKNRITGKIISKVKSTIGKFKFASEPKELFEEPVSDIRYVLLQNKEEFKLKQEDKDFFASIYLSDYMIDNCVRNNANYLGRMTEDISGKKSIQFDAPTDDATIRACFYAQNRPGILEKIDYLTLGKNQIEVDNIGDVFSILKERQTQRIYRDENKDRAKSVKNSRNKESDFTHG